MAGRLVMSGDIAGWLRELAADEPGRARAAAAAFVAVLDAPDLASAPYVTSLADSAGVAEDSAALSDCYQQLLTLMQELRVEVANAATLRRAIDQAVEVLADVADHPEVAARLDRLRQRGEEARQRDAAASRRAERLQSEIETFRARMEGAKASYTAAVGALEVRRAITESPLSEINEAQSAVAAAEASVREALRFGRRLVSQAGGRRAPAKGLLELEVGGYGDDEMRLLLAEQPPGSIRLLAVLHGEAAIAAHRADAITLASDLLDNLRAGNPPAPDADSPGELEFAAAEAFLTAFFPGSSDAIRADAADLTARLTLSQLRERLGVSDDDMAERMRMSPPRLRDFEQTSLTEHEPAQLSRYIAALGGDIRQAVIINGERFDLR